MRKLQPQKSEKNDLKKTEKFSQKNEAKFSQKIRWNSRTMEWLKIPKKVQREFRENVIAMNVDFMQYTCYKISEPLKNLYNILWFNWEIIDSDNSSILHNNKQNLSLNKIDTAHGYAYSIIFHSPGFAPLPIVSIEVYNEDKVKFLKTEWKIVFYGAYFVFRELLAEEAPEVLRFHNSIEAASMIKVQKVENSQGKKLFEKSLYKRTRVDIATDIALPMSKKWLSTYIQPHKNSKTAPRMYNYDPLTEIFQSVAYIPRLTQWIGIRIYNKVLDIHNKNKQSWHPTYWTDKNPIVTRLEIIYSWDTAQNTIENLMNYTKHRLFGDDQIKLKRHIRPKSQYSPLSAYEYFKRYAKNHGKSLKEVLDDVTCLMLIEEQKDLEY